MGFFSKRNSFSHNHSFWEVVNSGQEMSWHFGLGVVIVLSLSGVRKSWAKTFSHGKAQAILIVGDEMLPG